MPKNTIKGTNTRKGSNKKTGRDYSKEKEYQSSEARKKYRAELNQVNRDKGTYGNKDKKDVSHTKTGYTLEAQSKNRSRNGMKKGSKPSSRRTGTKK